MTITSKVNELEPYLPSSSEKKQAVMMYMVVGLVLSMGKWEVSPYTHHHLKQSLGWLVFLVLTIFADLFLGVLGLIVSFFFVFVVIITIPALTIGIMGIYQAQQGKYIRENEFINKFFLFFSGIGNWVLNLFNANHYQIIDAERYRTEEQFYSKPIKEDKPTKTDENSESSQTNKPAGNIQKSPVDNGNSAVNILDIQNHEINNDTVNTKTLDNDQQNVIINQDIGIDLSNHEINNSEDFKLEL